ncbi:MAG: trypsin-like peptidase domain-containing protein [Pirellulales bacterium]|nr:trypsin-like peptidase domain-containing protein [Pirellulales bacterium]
MTLPCNRRFFSLSRGSLSYAAQLAALWCWGHMLPPCHGQLLSPPPDPAVREQAFAELSREVEQLEQFNRVVKKCVALVRPSVVHIDADKVDSGGNVRRGIEEAGSGSIVELENKLCVITNRHVVIESSVSNIRIKLQDGRIINPRTMWSDSGTDIAVLELSESDIVPARFGDSDKIETADFVIAVGSPFGLAQSVTLGIISAKGRRDLELNSEVDIQDFLQTDAAINPGNSGGPLVNLRGEIIGMNTAIASQSGGGEGIGFAIPSNIVQNVARQLVRDGAVTRAYLGVTLDHKFSQSIAQRLGLPRQMGARVLGVTAKSPAEEAKLQPDDVILEFNGIPIDNDTHLVSLIGLMEVGKEFPMKLYRDKSLMSLQVKVAARAKFEQPRR